MEEVWHLLDPSHSHREPGDVLADADEVAVGTELWHALDRVSWPLDQRERASSHDWADVVRAANAFLSTCGREDV